MNTEGASDEHVRHGQQRSDLSPGLGGGASGPAPLAPASISLRLYPHDLDPAGVVDELRAQARLAEEVGFDGVMSSEHHGGFPNYLPNPLLMATWALEATERIWAAPCPMLLSLRATAHVVEDLAWTQQRFGGRIGAGFAAGAVKEDFDLAGVPFDEMVDRFKAALPEAADALRGNAKPPLDGDAAVAALSRTPIPTVSAASSPAAARRAAALQLGLLYDSITSIDRVAEMSAAHETSGGTGTRVLIRRAWIGTPPGESVERQMARFRAAAPASAAAHWAADGGLVAADDPAEVADRLHDQMQQAGCHALNLRVFHAGVTPDNARHQIELIGRDVLPLLRQRLAGPQIS